MTKHMESYSVCVNTALLDRYLNQQDKQDEAFNYVYEKIVYKFQDQLEVCECKEDIHDDLIFEINYLIERDSWDVNGNDLIKQIYKDYNIKDAK